MPPRDSYDVLLRKLAKLERDLEDQKRHRHPIGRNSHASGDFVGGLPGFWALNSTQTINANSNTTIVTYDDSTVEGDAIDFNPTTGVVTVNETGFYLVTASGRWPDIPPSVALECRTSSSGGASIEGLYDGRNFDNAGSNVDASNGISCILHWTAPFVFRLSAYQNGLGGATTAEIDDVVFSAVQVTAL